MSLSKAVAIVVALLAWGAAPALATPGDGLLSILVMGDSYSAGNGAGSYYGAKGCRRSSRNYGREFQRIVEAPPYRQRAFVETVACSGDETSAIQGSTSGRPPQVDAVNRGYDLVLMTLGGNDLDFGDIVKFCLIAKTRDGANCGPLLSNAERLIENGTVERRLTKAVNAVRSRVDPTATIVMLGYPYLEGDRSYTLRSGHGGSTFIKVGERLRALGDAGDRVQAKVMAASAPFLARSAFVGTKKLFAGPPTHELFAQKNNGDRWFVQPFVDGSVASRDTWYHPNPTGWHKEAELLAGDARVPKADPSPGATPIAPAPAPVGADGPAPSGGPAPGPAPAPQPSAPQTWAEQQGTYGANTFTNPTNASGMGPKIQPYQWVQVSCKVHAPQIQSANPDGYWYRIATAPWNDAYYAVANTFWNGDVPGQKPYTHNTDWAVRDC